MVLSNWRLRGSLFCEKFGVPLACCAESILNADIRGVIQILFRQFDIGLHAQTGHPCAVLPYKFEPQPTGRGGGAGRSGAPAAPAVPDTTPPVIYNPQPICAVLAGNLYTDDKILSVAHQYQTHTEWHLKHPKV